ncbi:MAG TPA: hypothetical protein DCL44_11765 [Elusimicrobia bacterium]|nr:hypothetical protein [Elusimicrobiota bacterium]
MPEMTFGVIMVCFIFALFFSGSVMWIVERKARASRRQITPFSHSFLAGCIAFSVVYVLNRLIFPHWPKATVVINLAMLGGIFSFRVLRKTIRRRWPKKGKKHRRSAEAAALESMLERDPLNAFCLEKLSEIYEEMGKKDKALEAAREALRLEHTMKNKWRVEDLEKTIREKKRGKSGWNVLKK